jgi:diguanylate cyclase (GGDEF)-like protein
MSQKPIKILLVEDNAGDARLFREMFQDQSSHEIELTRVESLREAETRLAGHAFDIILLDLGLTDAQGLEAVQRVCAAAPKIPLVVLTALDDEVAAAQALQEGAQDYLIKGQIETRGLLRAMRYAIKRKTKELASSVEKEEMTYSAQHDFLTGLPNRMLLSDRARQAIALAPRHKKKVAVLSLDLDGFKGINDSLGHSTGDKLLQSVAKRLVDCVRGSDTVSRQGGDEFVVLLSEVAQAEDAAVTAKRMLQAVGEAHGIDLHDLNVTASIGLSLYPDDGSDPETLVKNADAAMYQAKANGRKNYRFFTPAMNGGPERKYVEESLGAPGFNERAV